MAIILQDLGSGSGESVQRSITQASHGFSTGQWVYFNGTSYVLTNNSAAVSCEAPLLVISATTNTFVGVSVGFVSGLTGLVAGQSYYLGTTPGTITATEPLAGLFIKAVFKADSATSGYVLQLPTLSSNVTPPIANKYFSNTQAFTAGTPTAVNHNFAFASATEFEQIMVELRTSAGVRVDDTLSLFTANSVSISVPATLTNARVKIIKM
jgi:hypothetical protein